MRGSIRKRGKRWTAVTAHGRDPQTRKLRQKWTSHATRAEAEAHVTSVVAAVQGGTYTPPTKLAFGAFLDQWLRDYADQHVGPVTLRDYRTIVERHLKPALGGDPLPAISAKAIDRYCSDKRRTGLAASTVLKQYRVLHETLGHAVRWGLLVRNPADMAHPPRVDEGDLHPWDEEEIRLFLAEAKRSSHLYPLYLTAIFTGLRLGELLGLRWTDVDLALAAVTIRQTFYRLGREKLFKEPKSRASRRTIALPEAVVRELRHLREQQAEVRSFFGAEYAEGGLVFCQPTGQPLHAHNLSQRDFQGVIRRAKLRRIRFHDLRHTHASYLALAGVPVKVAQERLGHSTPLLTLKVYTHTLAGQDRAAAQAVESRLLGRLEQAMSIDEQNRPPVEEADR